MAVLKIWKTIPPYCSIKFILGMLLDVRVEGQCYEEASDGRGCLFPIEIKKKGRRAMEIYGVLCQYQLHVACK